MVWVILTKVYSEILEDLGDLEDLEELKQTWMAKMSHKTLFISAKTKENLDEMKRVLYEEIKKLHIQIYPYNNFLYDIIEEE